jgi:DNA-binding YbaB/EbfC family protein
MDMREMIERARAMQQKAAELQRAMEAVEVEGLAGGGLVRVTVAGNHVLKKVKIDPALLKPEENEIIEDLVVAAHADAKAKLDARLTQEMSHLAGKLGLPTGL